ncbi:MAG: carboxymuconolactone decarboxylase family protein [Alphaproteobacteria bacterium]
MPNPLLPLVDKNAMAPRWREAAQTAEREREEATFLQVAANAPEMLRWYYDDFYKTVFHSGRIERRMKELLRLKLSTLHGCAYCNRNNTKAARDSGVTQEQIDSIWDINAECFDDRERGVMMLAEQMAMQNMSGELTPEIYATLRRHFDDGQIVELGMTAAVLTGMAKFLFVFDLVSREANCPIKPRQ